MAAKFNSPEGELTDLFISEYEMIDRYVGDRLWSWGTNSYSQLGDNTNNFNVATRSSPVQTVAAGTNWKAVAANQHTVAVKTDGTLWTWGLGNMGQMGNNTTTLATSSPVQTVAAGTNWKQVAGGYLHTAALKTDGTLWTWGDNTSYGQLGDNTVNSRSSPVQTVCAGTDWRSVACGENHTAAIKTDGSLWLWGSGFNGQLGDNSNVAKSSPVQTVAAGTNWQQADGGGDRMSAIKTDGTLWMWGYNAFGMLGDNTVDRKSSPVQTVALGTNWKSVAICRYSTHALKTDGTLWVWGNGTSGQLGNNAAVDKSSPVQTVCAGTNWKAVDCGSNGNGAALKTDGTLWVWGYGGSGGLGNNASVDKSSPVQTVCAGTNWKAVACGDNHTVAVTYGDA